MTSDAKLRPCIFIPWERSMPSKLAPYFAALFQQGWPLIHQTYDQADVALNQAIHHFLSRTTFTHLVVLGMDHFHPPDIVHRLMRHIQDDPDKQVVGGVNVVRTTPFKPALYWLGEDGEGYKIEERTPGLVGPRAIIGMGCVAMSRQALETVGFPWFYNDWSGLKPGEFPSMDVQFCRRAILKGVTVWADPDIQSPHLHEVAINTQTTDAAKTATGIQHEMTPELASEVA